MRFNLLIISILLIGCDTIIKRDIQSFLNKNINISTNMFSSELLFCHKNKKIINDKTLRIIVYHDSTQCSPCALKNIYKWHDYMDNLDSLYGFTDINFIFSPPRNQVQELKLNLKTNLFEYPIFIDTLNQLNKNNAIFNNS